MNEFKSVKVPEYILPLENAVIGNRININGAGWRPLTHWLPLPRKDKNKVTK